MGKRVAIFAAERSLCGCGLGEDKRKIGILGTGCHDCLEMELRLAELVWELGLKAVEIQRVDDERLIRRYMTPATIPGLVIDGQLVSERQVPVPEILKGWLAETILEYRLSHFSALFPGTTAKPPEWSRARRGSGLTSSVCLIYFNHC